MQLTELGFETAEVTVKPATDDQKAKTITVRGVSPDDVMKLVRLHGSSIGTLFNSIMAESALLQEGDSLLDDVSRLGARVFEYAPEIAADLIVLATDTPTDQVAAAHEVAVRLPLAVQIDALEKIAQLTFVENDGLKKFVETVLRMLGGTNGLLALLQTSTAGSLVSDETSPSSEETAS